MKKFLSIITSLIAICVLHVVTANAAPTSTIVPNLIITGVKNAPCLGTDASGLAFNNSGNCGSGGGSSTLIYAGNQFLLVNQVGANATLTPVSVLSLQSSTDISFSSATGTNITATFLNPKAFTTTTIQSVLNSLSAIGLASYNSSTGQFSVSSSSLNLSQYVTTSTASTTYLTIVNASNTYYLLTNPAGYVSSSIINGLITSASATAAFQPLLGFVPINASTSATSTWLLTSNGSIWYAAAPPAGGSGVATTTINGGQYAVFHIIGDGSTITSTVAGATTTFSVINPGWLTSAITSINGATSSQQTITGNGVTVATTPASPNSTTTITINLNNGSDVNCSPAARVSGLNYDATVNCSQVLLTLNGSTLPYESVVGGGILSTSYTSSSMANSATTTISLSSAALKTYTDTFGYITTSTGLSTANFATNSISQWNNDAGYITTSTNNFGGITTSTYNASITIATAAPLGGGAKLSNNGTISLTCTGCLTTSTLLGTGNFNTSSISQWNNNSGYITTSTGLSTANFATNSISQWNNNAGYLTGNQSISFTATGDATGTGSGATSISAALNVGRLQGKNLPIPATGTLYYTGSALNWGDAVDAQGNQYVTSTSGGSGVNINSAGTSATYTFNIAATTSTAPSITTSSAVLNFKIPNTVRLASWVVAPAGGDYTTIQPAMDACGTAGGGTIYIQAGTYSQGSTGLLWKGSNCKIYGVNGTTTITFTGATTGFKSNSLASQYNHDELHNLTITGDGTANSVAIAMGDMSHNDYEDLTIDDWSTGIQVHDTTDITFYNNVSYIDMSTLGKFGIDGSSTEPWNGNMFSNMFIGCSTANCISIADGNSEHNTFTNIYEEPASAPLSGSIGVSIFDAASSTNPGNFGNIWINNYMEGNATAVKVAKATTCGSGECILGDMFVGGISDTNGTLTLPTSTGVTFLDFNNNFQPETTLAAHVGITGETSQPTLSSCGATACTLDAYGNDDVGKITMNTGAQSAATLTFAITWPVAPVCTANIASGTAVALSAKTTTSAVVFTSASAMTATGTIIGYTCFGDDSQN